MSEKSAEIVVGNSRPFASPANSRPAPFAEIAKSAAPLNTMRCFATRLFIVLICMVVLAAQYCSGTAVIVLRNGNKLWIAADSMQTDQTGTIFRSDCKILEKGEFYWAAAGPVYSDSRTGFEVKTLVDGIRSKKGTLRSEMNTFIAKSKGPIASELASIRKDTRLRALTPLPANL